MNLIGYSYGGFIICYVVLVCLDLVVLVISIGGVYKGFVVVDLVCGVILLGFVSE